MQEYAQFIQVGEGNLFAVTHEPKQAVRRGAFIFCHPFVEEKLWSHRAYVSFARNLSSLGYLVIRFDMRGYGDSSGDFIDISLAESIKDTLDVIDYVQRTYEDIEGISLFGLRLGATIAALVAEECNCISKLVLWEPVVRGDRYMQEFLRSNLAAQMLDGGEVKNTRDDLVQEMKNGTPVNVEGYPLTYRCYSDVSDINLLARDRYPDAPCLINQIVRNENQPFNKDLEQLANCYREADLMKSDEKQFWREIKEFYDKAEHLSASTLSWL